MNDNADLIAALDAAIAALTLAKRVLRNREAATLDDRNYASAPARIRA